MKRSTWLHLRIPFSFFLLPVFLFAVSQSNNIDWINLVLTFIILHVFLYPASNGYNSYFDKDEGSIGGLKHPPRVSLELYYVALSFDLFAVTLGLVIGWEFALMLLTYGLVSKAYSHPWVRLKKLAITGWLIAGIFQGAFTFLMTYMAINNLTVPELVENRILMAALLTTGLLWGSYPMTQVYQHEEDIRRGDRTISVILGIRGTFYFTSIIFLLANVGFIFFFLTFHTWTIVLLFEILLLPMLGFFTYWLIQVLGNEKKADFGSTMRLNTISAISLNSFFLLLYMLTH